MGQQVSNALGILECRPLANSQYAYIQTSKTIGSISNPTSPNGLETCRITDQRSSKTSEAAIAYPSKPESGFSNFGVQHVAVLPIDFSDVPGNSSELTALLNEIKPTAEWVDQFSHGRMKYEVHTVNHWLRAPRPSADYWMPHPGQSGVQVMSEADIMRTFTDLSENEINYSNISTIWVIHPRSYKAVTDSISSRGNTFVTGKYGPVRMDMFSTGSNHLTGPTPLWQYFMHENLHSHGLLGHSPSVPYISDLMSNGGAPARTLSTWNQLILDWLRPQDVYCIAKENLSSQKITLVPLERKQDGVQSVMVRISDHQVLVIESHRKETWSKDMPNGFYGVMAYLVDTQKDTDFNYAFSTSQSLKGTWSGHPSFQYGGGSWNLDYVMFEGETLSVEGVKVDFTSTGDNDTITISKLG
jgi:hypothetical protein